MSSTSHRHNPQYRPTYAGIHTDHLIHNIRLIRNLFFPGRGGEEHREGDGYGNGNDFLCPMIKANAYGHGDLIVARTLESINVRYLGVCLIEEGIRLRQGGIERAQILVFGVFQGEEELREMIRYRLTPIVSTPQELEILDQFFSSPSSAHSLSSPLLVHVKLDTGMHRLGFPGEEAHHVFERLAQLHPRLQVEGVLTHLHSGEDALFPGGESDHQIERFQRLKSLISSLLPRPPRFFHYLNSAGGLGMKERHRDGVDGQIYGDQSGALRPGLLIYGVSPYSPDSHSSSFSLIPSLRPVMSLRSRVVHVNFVKKGEVVSYGGIWRAPKDSLVGVVPIGYADGYPRILSNKGQVLIREQEIPVVGAICMDSLMVDLTELLTSIPVGKETDFVGDEVTLFGYSSAGTLLPVEGVAQWASTITWEILTGVSDRVPRREMEGFR